ncbi:translation initiation factor IF-2 [Aerococcus urinae]
MSKKRVYEYAKEKNISSKELLASAKKAGLSYTSHMSSMTDEDIQTMEKYFAKEKSQPKQKESSQEKQGNKQSQSEKAGKKQEKRNNNKGEKKPANKQEEKGQDHKKNDGQSGKNSQSNTNKKANKKNNKKNRRKNNKQSKYEDKHLKHNQRKKVQHNNSSAPSRKKKESPEKIEFTDGMTVAELAKKIKRSPADIIKSLMMLGVMANQNQALDSDTIQLILAEYGIEAEEKVIIDPTDFDHYFEEAKEEKADNLKERPAVVTIMGHVDHGKTTLLDYLRHANVVEGEAGGITQHIGAYQVHANDKEITFLDTPGHAAFTTMRSRGADVTDIVVIVVAADDGVMPQTVEAINHAKAAEVPIIVAVNKIDKPQANPDRVKQELTEYELIPEEWGGDTIFVNISAKFGENIDELLEMILLVAEVEELKANPNRNALGSVIEAELDAHRGAVATILVQEGTLHQGDAIVVGDTYGRVRTMTNDQGRRIKSAGPSTPIEITGLQEAPQAGDRFVVFDDEKTARNIGERRAQQAQELRRHQTHKVTLDNLFDTIKEGEMKTVNIIIKDLDAETDEENIPPILLAILPLITLVAIILIFSDVPNIILIALTVGILLSAFLYRKYLPKQTSLLNDGANSAVPSAFATSSSVAFGSVLTSAPGFSVVQDAIMSIPGNPLIGLSVATALLGGITGSSSGALGIVMQNFAPTYLEMGIAPELIHRIAVVASAVITVVPHSGVTITFNNLTGLSLKNAFMHQFIMVNGGHLLALIAMLIASTILY